VERKTFRRSDFHLGGFSVPVAAISASWLIFTSLIFFWPEASPVTPTTMNYTCVVVGAVGILGALYWVYYARHFFQGPRRSEKLEGGDSYKAYLSPPGTTAQRKSFVEIVSLPAASPKAAI
jgi:hypothetical protein